jgi:hypothetical protein
MDGRNTAYGIERDGRGRFAPGVSGNPAGKKKGTRNRATRLDEMLGEGTNAQVLEKAVKIAMDGDVQLLNRFVDRSLPKPRGETIRLVLPEGTLPGDPVALYNAAYIALANGEITIDQALGLCKFIEGREAALDGHHRKRDLEYYGNKIPGDEAFRGYVWPGPEEKSCQPSAFSLQLEIPQPVVAPPAFVLQIQEVKRESHQPSAASAQPKAPEPAPASALRIKAPAAAAASGQEPTVNGQQPPSTPPPFVPDPALPGRRRSILRQRAAFEKQQGQTYSPGAKP